MKKVLILVSIFVLVVILSTVAYVAHLSFAQRVAFQRNSLAYFILAPKVLAHAGEFCVTDAQFTYNSADGPKPTITAMACRMSYASLSRYLSGEGYRKISADEFKKENVQINVERGHADLVSKVIVLNYL